MKEVIINVFAFGSNLNWNAWYVYFYIFCMMIMPIVYRVFRFQLIVNIGIAVGVPYCIEAAIHVLLPNYQDITMMQVLFSCMLYFGVFLVGFLMAKNNVISKYRMHWMFGVLSMVIAVGLRIALRHVYTFGFNMDVFYAPIFVVGAENFFEGINGKRTKAFNILGKYSTGMWFIHAVFFATYVRDYFQTVMLIVKQPELMYVWLVLLSLGSAFVFERLLDGIHQIPRLVKGRNV